jgi:hypothetical protein
MAADVKIDIAAEFTGKKAFKQAETSTDKLIKGTKRLAGSIGLAFGTAQVIAFGKASVKAALEAQAQQERLANLVKVTVGATEFQIQALNDQAAALQDIGVVNKENITQTQSQLATFNLQIDTIKQLTPAILDYVTAEKGAAASASEFKSMTNGLAQALNGNFASLTKVGFVLDEATKKTIKNGTETERAAALVKVLNSTYKDFNKNLANTPTGQMQKLANAADDARQKIGEGLLGAMVELGGAGGIGTVTKAIDELSLGLSESLISAAKLVTELQKLPVLGDYLGRLFSNPLSLPKEFLVFGKGGLLDSFRAYGKVAGIQKATDNAHLKSLLEQFNVIKKTSNSATKLTAEELKKLKAKQLAAAIDKANLALGKGGTAFDMEAIQLEAAKINQVEQLKKATSASQLLAITNDLTRLSVLKDIKKLEDAIASGDIKRIEAATKALNESTKLLGVLTNQELKIIDIKKLLEALAAKDLISLKNLNDAKAILESLNIPSGGIIKVEISAAAEAALAALAAATAAAKVLAGGTVKKKFTGEEITDILRRLTSGQKITVAEGLAIGVTDPKSLRPDVATDIENRTTTSNSPPLPTAVPSALGDPALLASIIAAISIAATAAAENAAAIKAGTAQPVSVTNNFNGVIGDPNALASLITSIVQNAIDRGTIKAGTLV